MAKKESTFLNMFLTLFIVTALSSLAASIVYNLTKGPIDEVARLKQQRAIEQVMPRVASYNEHKVMPASGKDSLTFFFGFRDNEKLGVAIISYTYTGYSGLIKIMVGFTPDGTIKNIEVLAQKETPGLGTKMAEPKFKDQFVGKNLADYKDHNILVAKEGGVIDAITAATITSRAFCDAVNRAYHAWEENKTAKN